MGLFYFLSCAASELQMAGVCSGLTGPAVGVGQMLTSPAASVGATTFLQRVGGEVVCVCGGVFAGVMDG